MSGPRLLAAAATALVLLTGCTETAGVGPVGTGAATAGSASARAGSDGTPSDLATRSPATRSLGAQKKAAGIADCPRSDPGAAPVAGGLPDVVLPCLGGGRSVRLAGLRGTPTVVSVWAQWCPPCRAEAPYVSEVAGESSGRVRFLGVDYVDPQPARAIAFARYSGWTYPQLADPDQLLAAPLQLLGPPRTLFVRADGTVAGQHSGPFTSAHQLRDLVREQLGVDL